MCWSWVEGSARIPAQRGQSWLPSQKCKSVWMWTNSPTYSAPSPTIYTLPTLLTCPQSGNSNLSIRPPISTSKSTQKKEGLLPSKPKKTTRKRIWPTKLATTNGSITYWRAKHKSNELSTGRKDKKGFYSFPTPRTATRPKTCIIWPLWTTGPCGASETYRLNM